MGNFLKTLVKIISSEDHKCFRVIVQIVSYLKVARDSPVVKQN